MLPPPSLNSSNRFVFGWYRQMPCWNSTTCFGFALFCLVASSVYLFNDIVDLEKDKLHPAKAHRPLPSGKLSVSTASGAALILAGNLLNLRTARRVPAPTSG